MPYFEDKKHGPQQESSGLADVTLLFVVRGVRVMYHKERMRDRGGGDRRAGSICLVYFRWLEVVFFLIHMPYII